MTSRVLQLDARDNVLVALTNLKRGETVECGGKTQTLNSDVSAKHKFAIAALAPGDRVVMDGGTVGSAVKPIAAGELLTTTNIRHQASPFHRQEEAYRWSPPDVSRWNSHSFDGYLRS